MCIKILEMDGQVKSFEETKYISRLIKDDQLRIQCNKTLDRMGKRIWKHACVWRKVSRN